MSVAAALTAIQVAQNFKDVANSAMMINGEYQRSDSLISYTNTCRVEPITLVDEKCAYLPFLGEILQTAHSIFAGYYLQAVSLEAVIGSVQVIKRLDKFSPNRSANIPTFEDFKDGLPKYGVEAYDSMMNHIPDKAPEKNIKPTTMTGSGDSLRTIKDANNMAVGKVIEITLTHEDRSISIPIAIRLNTKTIDNQSLLHILGQSKQNKTAKDRYHGWKSGELEFWKDIVLCEDLIKAHRTTLAHDKSGTYAEMRNRATKNASAAAMSKEFSVGTASAITIISDSTRKELEFQIAGKLSDFKTRQQVFEDCYMMLLFVVDAEYEHVTIYHRGLNMSTDMSLREMKLANKNDGGMITDVLKAFISGHAPTF